MTVSRLRCIPLYCRFQECLTTKWSLRPVGMCVCISLHTWEGEAGSVTTQQALPGGPEHENVDSLSAFQFTASRSRISFCEMVEQ